MTTLERTTFKTSRLLEFCTRKELTIQTGQQVETWPLVVLKELVDNALDAAEEAGVAPAITVAVDKTSIAVTDNGPGIPIRTVKALLDFSIRVSSREAYVSPTRGAQGNALKCLWAMPFVLDGTVGRVEIAAQGVNHAITFKVDPIRQAPVIDHFRAASSVKRGTKVTVHWPDSAKSWPRPSVDFYKLPTPTLGSTLTSISRSTADITRHHRSRPGRSGSPPIRLRRIGTISSGSSD